MKIKSNIYRSRGEWFHATWIDGEFDSADVLAATSEEEAAAEVQWMYGPHTVTRVEDVE